MCKATVIKQLPVLNNITMTLPVMPKINLLFMQKLGKILLLQHVLDKKFTTHLLKTMKQLSPELPKSDVNVRSNNTIAKNNNRLITSI